MTDVGLAGGRADQRLGSAREGLEALKDVQRLRARVMQLEAALTEQSDRRTAAATLASELSERVRLLCSERDAAQSQLARAQQEAAASKDLFASLQQAVDERKHAQEQLRLEREIALSRVAEGQRQLVAVRKSAADELRAAIEAASAAKLAQLEQVKEQAMEQQARALEQCTAEMMEAVGNILQQADAQREAEARERAAEVHREAAAAAEAAAEGASESEGPSDDEDASLNPDVQLGDVQLGDGGKKESPTTLRVHARVLRARGARRLVLEDELERLRAEATAHDKTASQLRAQLAAQEATAGQLRAQLAAQEATASQLKAQLHGLQAAAPAMEAAAQAAAEVEALQAKAEQAELAVTDLEKRLQVAQDDLKKERAETAKLQTAGQAKPSFVKQVKRTPQQYQNETSDSKGGTMFAKQVCVWEGRGVSTGAQCRSTLVRRIVGMG